LATIILAVAIVGVTTIIPPLTAQAFIDPTSGGKTELCNKKPSDGPDLAAAPSSIRASFCLRAVIYLLIESEWSLFLSNTYAA
jgi:hypothetical protein